MKGLLIGAGAVVVALNAFLIFAWWYADRYEADDLHHGYGQNIDRWANDGE